MAGIRERLQQGGHCIFTYDPVIDFSELQAGEVTASDGEEPAGHRLYPEAVTAMLDDNGLRQIRHRLNETRPGPNHFVGAFVVARHA